MRNLHPENPFESLHNTMVFSSNDWGSAADFAWLYGIAVGWDDEPDDPSELRVDAMAQVAKQFGWSDEKVARLRRLHDQFQFVRCGTLTDARPCCHTTGPHHPACQEGK